MPFGEPGGSGGGGGGGGGGNANLGILLRAEGETDLGLFISHRSGDLTWHAQAEARRDAEAAVAAQITFENNDQDATVDFRFPLDWNAPPEIVNRHAISYTRFPDPFAGTKADADYGRLAITWATVGAEGNSQRYRATAGTAAVAAQNAKADIEGSRGVTPGHDGVIRVTSPDATGTVDAVAGVNPRYGSNSAFLNVRALVPGTAMNGFTLAFRTARDNSQTETLTWAATYSSDNRTLNIVATLNTFDLAGASTAGLVTAINNARTAQGAQLVEANGTTFLSRGESLPITINYLRSGDNPSRNINGLVFSGGTHASGGGTATNRGQVRVVASAARVAGTAATYVWQIVAGRQITLTFHQVGVSGNDLQFSTREETSVIANNTVRATDSGADFLLQYRGSMTLGTIVDAMNAATSRFTVAITQGSRADSVTPSGNVGYRTSGGVDPVNPLSAVWDADEHRLTVTALASDEFRDVRAAIVALSEFQLGDGTSAGDVQIEDQGRVDDTIDVPGTVGEHVDYGFTGGTDAVARTPLTVAERSLGDFGGFTGYILDILGVLNTDTVQDAIDAYSGSRFQLAAASGSQTTDRLSGSAVNPTALTGGRDAVPRQTPTFGLADTGVVSIGLHANDERSDNTTLFELITAWIAATYTDGDGATQTIGSMHHTPDLTGGGALTDQVNSNNLPQIPTGGRNEVAANITEIEARPDDEFDGPNILLKYDEDETLAHIKSEFEANNNGGFTFTLVYGTDGTANPEEPPFNRSFYDGGAVAGGGEGTAPVLLHTFTWSASTADLSQTDPAFADYDYLIFEGWVGGNANARQNGYGAIKRTDLLAQTFRIEFAQNNRVAFSLSGANALGISELGNNDQYGEVRVWGAEYPIGGGEAEDGGGLSQSEVDSRIRALTKGSSLRGGPVVPESDIDDAIARDAEIKPYALRSGGSVVESDIPASIARDTEVPRLVSEALTDRTPGAGRTDEVPFLTRGGAWSKATTETFRELFASYVGTWPVAAGFIYRVGDLTDHDGRVYFVNTQHTADATNGPETNAHYTPLDNWVGTITQNWYRAGSLGLYNGGLYGAIADVVNTDALPSVDHAKWLLLSHDSRAILEGGVYNNAATYKANRIVRKADAAYLTTRDVPAGINPGTTANWADYYVRLGYVDGAPDSLTGIAVTGNRLRLTTRGGTHHDETLPSGGTEVAANPAGTDGDVLTRLEIDGTNWILGSGAEVPVGMGQLVGRITSTAGKFPADLPAATPPIQVPIPTYGDLTDGESPGGDAAAWKAASRDWPVVPLTAIGADGGVLSSLDTTENSVVVAEGMYIVGCRAQNIWVNNIPAGNDLSGTVGTTDFGNPRAGNPARLIAEVLIEYLDSDGTTWLELSKSFAPYTRRAPYANQVAADGGTNASGNPGSTWTAADENLDNAHVEGTSAYDGTRSPVSATMYTVINVPPGGLTIRFRMERGDAMAPIQVGGDAIVYDDEGFPNHPSAGSNRHLGQLDGITMPWGYFCDIPGISFFPLGRPTQTAPLVPRPHITSFDHISGDLAPVAGDISGATYGYSYTIAQGSHVGAARIIGFKGATKPAGSATVLATLTDFNRGGGTVDIPANVSLADGEEYRIRLQIFEEGVTPGVDTVPAGYHDIVITAHAAATALYHTGRVPYDSDDADAAATVARIVFATHDTQTWGALPSEFTLDLPDDGNDYQAYFAAASSATQPAGFTLSGQPATQGFTEVTATISSVEYKVWVQKPNYRVTHDTENGNTYGVTP